MRSILAGTSVRVGVVVAGSLIAMAGGALLTTAQASADDFFDPGGGGDSSSGDFFADEASADSFSFDDSSADDSLSGDSLSGDPLSGDSLSGDPLSGGESPSTTEASGSSSETLVATSARPAPVETAPVETALTDPTSAAPSSGVVVPVDEPTPLEPQSTAPTLVALDQPAPSTQAPAGEDVASGGSASALSGTVPRSLTPVPGGGLQLELPPAGGAEAPTAVVAPPSPASAGSSVPSTETTGQPQSATASVPLAPGAKLEVNATRPRALDAGAPSDAQGSLAVTGGTRTQLLPGLDLGIAGRAGVVVPPSGTPSADGALGVNLTANPGGFPNGTVGLQGTVVEPFGGQPQVTAGLNGKIQLTRQIGVEADQSLLDGANSAKVTFRQEFDAPSSPRPHAPQLPTPDNSASTGDTLFPVAQPGADLRIRQVGDTFSTTPGSAVLPPPSTATEPSTRSPVVLPLDLSSTQQPGARTAAPVGAAMTGSVLQRAAAGEDVVAALPSGAVSDTGSGLLPVGAATTPPTTETSPTSAEPTLLAQASTPDPTAQSPWSYGIYPGGTPVVAEPEDNANTWVEQRNRFPQLYSPGGAGSTWQFQPGSATGTALNAAVEQFESSLTTPNPAQGSFAQGAPDGTGAQQGSARTFTFDPSTPNPFKGGIYALSGAGASFLTQRALNPSLTVGQYLPNAVRGGVQDYIFVNGAPCVKTGETWTDATLAGLCGAAANQGLTSATRWFGNDALNNVVDRHTGAPAGTSNVHADFVLGTGRIDLPLLDPRTTTVSPGLGANTSPTRLDIGPIPTPTDTPTTADLTAGGGAALVDDARDRGVTATGPTTPGDVPEFRRPTRPGEDGQLADTRVPPFPTYDIDPATGKPRQGAYTVFQLRDLPPEVERQVHRTTNLSAAGMNVAGSLLNTAVDQLLASQGQQNNYPLDVLADAGVNSSVVGGLISAGEGRIVPGAFINPAWQTVVARLASDALLGTAPPEVQKAVADACSDEDADINVAKWAVCNLGENPGQGGGSPPTGPPPGAPGGAIASLATGNGGGLPLATQPAAPTTTGQTTTGQTTTGQTTTGAVSAPGTPSPALSTQPTAPPALRPDSRYPLCGDGVADGCIDPLTLFDHDHDGVADNAGTLRDGIVGARTVGQGFAGPKLVGPGLVGPKVVGRGLVGPKLVGPKLVGPKLVGPKLVGPKSVGVGDRGTADPATSPAITEPTGTQAAPQARIEAQPNLLQQGVQVVEDLYDRADRAGRESLRTTISASHPLDGTLGFGVTRHQVEFMDGGRGVYDPEGNLLTVEQGNPPQKVAGWQLFKPGGDLFSVPGRAAPGGVGAGGALVPGL